jgi:hypothetical protein
MGQLPMGLSNPQLVLLPGLDGTGQLFRGLIGVLPAGMDAIVVSYPKTGAQGYEDLLPRVS